MLECTKARSWTRNRGAICKQKICHFFFPPLEQWLEKRTVYICLHFPVCRVLSSCNISQIISTEKQGVTCFSVTKLNNKKLVHFTVLYSIGKRSGKKVTTHWKCLFLLQLVCVLQTGLELNSFISNSLDSCKPWLITTLFPLRVHRPCIKMHVNTRPHTHTHRQ